MENFKLEELIEEIQKRVEKQKKEGEEIKKLLEGKTPKEVYDTKCEEIKNLKIKFQEEINAKNKELKDLKEWNEHYKLKLSNFNAIVDNCFDKYEDNEKIIYTIKSYMYDAKLTLTKEQKIL